MQILGFLNANKLCLLRMFRSLCDIKQALSEYGETN